jgi:hypothetical protein
VVKLGLHRLHLGFELGGLFHQAHEICHFLPLIMRGSPASGELESPPALPRLRGRTGKIDCLEIIVHIVRAAVGAES